MGGDTGERLGGGGGGVRCVATGVGRPWSASQSKSLLDLLEYLSRVSCNLWRPESRALAARSFNSVVRLTQLCSLPANDGIAV
ncbi:hypothetical protein BC629DRAFT_1496950 [Irpex lacteus]|nr:hypothetical protein BC629DRAFT_1496950 [Irpex lacteus]